MNILAHAPIIGETGFANHARMFFLALNKYHNVKVRNYTIGKSWQHFTINEHDKEFYMTDELRNMLILQTLYDSDGRRRDYPIYNYDFSFKPDIHIVLMDVHHSYFYEDYGGYKIAYTVWETTEYPKDFFQRLFYFDELWVPSEWQREVSIKQGYPADKVFVVPEGVDSSIFRPLENRVQKDKFRFLLFGRWEYRKSTIEILQTFEKLFKDNNNVELICSIENSFARDGFTNTEDRLKHYGITANNIKPVKFLDRDEYIKYLREGDVFISCARSEGWNLPLSEAIACGTPSTYSNWGAQLEFAKGLGIPVNVLYEVPASNQDKSFTGNYVEPDFNDLENKLIDVYENYEEYKSRAVEESKIIRNKFDWDLMAQHASNHIKKIKMNMDDFVFVTTGNKNYMPLIEKLVLSLNEFSKYKIIVYGVDCEVPFDYPNLIKRKIEPKYYSTYDKWYWKQYACIESLKEEYDNFVWIDGDVIVNHNIDNIKDYFKDIENYPLSDIHVNEEFFIEYYEKNQLHSQLFNENLSKLWGVTKYRPYMHVCLYIYNKKCDWWFKEIIETYKSINLDDYKKYFSWNDEGIDNALRWKYGYVKHLPLSNFDTSSYDGDLGQTNDQLKDFYTFWNKRGPYNFHRVYGYQYIPENKDQILYFHGNKNYDIADKMINFIKMKRDNSFYESEYFYIEKDVLLNLGDIKGVQGGTVDIAYRYGWPYAIYHEIYNLLDYYKDRIKAIHKGDIVVDLGANVGIFNRWAYSEGASKVISFEPDKRYFEVLSMNADPRSILFNAAMSDKIGTAQLTESTHLGGSHILDSYSDDTKYTVRTYNLDYFFDTGLIDRIDFLKIDIEGAEQLALKGISDENLSKVRNIAMEYHHGHLNFDEVLRDNLIRRLNNLGFNSYLLFLGNSYDLQYIYFWK